MTTATATTVQRTPSAISAALAEHAPADRAQFETELKEALSRAAEDLDLAGVNVVLNRWHALATMAANPLTESERSLLARARAGDFTGLYARDEQGNWTQR